MKDLNFCLWGSSATVYISTSYRVLCFFFSPDPDHELDQHLYLSLWSRDHLLYDVLQIHERIVSVHSDLLWLISWSFTHSTHSSSWLQWEEVVHLQEWSSAKNQMVSSRSRLWALVLHVQEKHAVNLVQRAKSVSLLLQDGAHGLTCKITTYNILS